MARLPQNDVAGRHVRRRRFRTARKVVRKAVIVLVVVGVVGAASVAAYAGWSVRELDHALGRVRIRRVSAAQDGVVHAKPTAAPMPENASPQTYLLLGNDTREGRSSTFLDKKHSRSGQGGGGADSIILVRVDPQSQRTEMVSIHRDLRVRIPKRGYGKINSTYVLGGPSLTVSVVEGLTGVHIDHVVIVDFAGFRDVVDAVGGVTLCLETAEKDRYTGLNLPAGCSHVNGTQALSYARSRHTKLHKDGRWVADLTDDFGRMHRQQAFLKALAKEMASPGQLAHLPSLARSLKGTITIDDGLDVIDGVRLARRMSGRLDNVATAAFPVYDMNIGGVSYAGLDTKRAAALMAKFNAGTMETVTIEKRAPLSRKGGADLAETNLGAEVEKAVVLGESGGTTGGALASLEGVSARTP